MASRLDDAVSPYLRAHAGNPVSWYPWDEAAFAEAAARDVPVMISIGYATCHWCHVMARESFSDPAIAELLDARFVAIKVDREEHPEVDAAYLAAASAFTRQLGWPLTVFADASGRAFYAGTYFPPRPVPGVPAFRDVLLAVDEAWRERRAELTATSEALAGALAESSVFGAESPLPSRERLEAAAAILAKGEDPVHGGFGGAPKFPVAPVLSFLAGLGPGERALAARTLLRMGASALRDPVDGGFFRYATRADWTEPHYERMLSDNALLLNVATDLTAAAERDGSPDAPRLRVLAGELIRFLLDTMRLPGGGFASAQDSESVIDGVRNEGGYYQRDRDGRVGLTPPALDEKVLTGWNGLAVGALARAGALLADETALDAARAAADWLLAHHVPAGHPMVRASRDGAASGAAATLEDFGMLAQGLLALAEASGAHRYAVAARDLVDRALDAAGDGPFGAPPDGPDPVLASRGLVLEADPAEGATPSGVTTIADAARLLHALGAGDRYLDAAHRTLARVAETALSQPIAFGSTLRLLADLDAPLVQVVTVVPDATSGPLDDGVGALIAETRRAEASVAVVVTDAQSRAFADAGFELFVGRSSAGGAGALAYRCEAFTCALPVTDAAALRDLAA